MKYTAIKFLFLLLFVLLQISFAQTNKLNKSWKQFKKCDFTFSAPKTLKEQEAYEIDSCVGKFEDENITVTFDYGWYGGKSKRKDYMLDFRETSIEIGGKPGQLVTYIFDNKTNYPPPKKYISQIFVEVLSAADISSLTNRAPNEDIEPTSLMMGIEARNEKGLEIAKRIFKSIKFS